LMSVEKRKRAQKPPSKQHNKNKYNLFLFFEVGG